MTDSEPRQEAPSVVSRTHVIDGVAFTATGPEAAVTRTVDRIARALDWYEALAGEVRRQRAEKGKRREAMAESAREGLTG